MLLERSSAGKYAKSVFYEEVNDIDIFIEDTAEGYEKLYKSLLERVFLGTYRVNTVFPLGDRNKVIKECEKVQDSIPRPTIFIIDADLFLLNKKEPTEGKKLKGLYILPKYCIENILLDEDAIVEIMNEEDLSRNAEQLKYELDFSNWISINKNFLLHLYIEYAISSLLTPHLETVGFPLKRLISSADGHIDIIKTGKRISDLFNEILNHSNEADYWILKDKILSCVDFSDINFTSFISGKDVLLPLILMRIRSIVKTKTPHINLKIRLAMKVNISCISNMKEYVAKT